MLKGENVTVQQNLNAVKICRKHGLEVTGSFILGSPGEKIKDMRKTLEVIRKAEQKTKHYDSFYLNIAIGYGGRQEIADAFKKLDFSVFTRENSSLKYAW